VSTPGHPTRKIAQPFACQPYFRWRCAHVFDKVNSRSKLLCRASRPRHPFETVRTAGLIRSSRFARITPLPMRKLVLYTSGQSGLARSSNRPITFFWKPERAGSKKRHNCRDRLNPGVLRTGRHYELILFLTVLSVYLIHQISPVRKRR
jgi:hypothetical protein